MRAFIAIELSQDVREKLADFQEEMKDMDCKPVEVENLHLTLKFLGTIDDDAARAVSKKLKTIKFKPFTVKISSAGVFPNHETPNVVWVGGENPPELEQLKGQINHLLFEFKSEEREHKSHITLARMKNSKRDADMIIDFVNQVNDHLRKEPLEFDVKGFKFLKSTLLSRGPVYEEIDL